MMELLLWSGLMPPAHVRTGDPGTWILGWIHKCKSGSTDLDGVWINSLQLLLDPWIYRFYRLLDSATLRCCYMEKNDSWTT